MNRNSASQMSIKKTKDELMCGLPVNPGIVKAEILQSWSRSKDFGLKPNMDKLSDVLTGDQLAERLEDNNLLISVAKNILSDFFHFIKEADSGSIMMLCDREAYLLAVFGDTANDLTTKMNIKLGICFGEAYSGTTPAALALKYDRPYEMSGAEYFLEMYADFRDFSVPVHDEEGQIIGTIELAVVKETQINHAHTYAMIVAIASIIEKQLQLMKAINEKIFFSSSLVASMASLEEGLVILGTDNRVVHVNPYVENMLGVALQDVRNQSIEIIFRNQIILGAIHGKLPLVDTDVVLDESVTRQRYLVSVNPIMDANGLHIGLTLTLKEFKSIRNLIHRVVGLQAPHTFEDIQGDSLEIKNVIRISKAISKRTSNVLLVGESGTGKELIAQSIHNMSLAAAGPFMAINCAAFPSEMIESEIFGYEPGTFTGGLRQGKPGKLELANGGTLFLDEVNGMSLDMQVKLLRVLEEKRFQRLGGHRYIGLDARIIAATNQDLRERIALGYFRIDLYYRLAVVEIQIPPLRQRRQDIGIYVDYFIRDMNGKLGRSIQCCTQEVMDYLFSYSWPGNVRELRNWIERAASLSDGNILTIDDFPYTKHHPEKYNPVKLTASEATVPSLSEPRESDQRRKIIFTLDKHGGNVQLASGDLGISRATLYRKIKQNRISLFRQVR